MASVDAVSGLVANEVPAVQSGLEDLLADEHASKQLSGSVTGLVEQSHSGDGASKTQDVVPPSRTTRELAVARQSQELLYVVEWDDEGSFSEVKRKWLVDDPDPSVGQKVKVREGSRKKVFSGTVMMKGTKHEVAAFMKEKEEEDESMSEPEANDTLDILEVLEVLDEAPKAKRRKPQPADNEAKAAKKAASKAKVGKNKAREQARRRESEKIISEMGLAVFAQLGIPFTTSAPLSTATSATVTSAPLLTTTSALLPTTTTTTSTSLHTTPSRRTHLNGLSTTTSTYNTVPISSSTHSPASASVSETNQPALDLSNNTWDDYDDWMGTPGQRKDVYEVISDMKKDFEKEMAKMQASIDELKKSIRRREKRVSREARSEAEVECPVTGSSASGMNRRVSNGAVLGDPISASRFEFPNISMDAVIEAENASTIPAKLATNLLSALFMHEELATGNCTKANRADIKLLDQVKIQAIRAHVNYKYPTTDEAEGKRWIDIRTKSLNGKCRACRTKATTVQ